MWDVTDSSPSVSVIIPTHNRCEMLRCAIQSVLDQTYGDLEVIVIDDASTDMTSETVEHFCDDRIRYIRHKENRGGSASRNTGMACARGRYVGFLDDDDEWLPNKLEQQISRFQKRPDVDVVCSAYLVRDAEKDRVIGSFGSRKSGYIYKDLLMENIIGTTSTVLIKRDSLKDFHRFDTELPSYQDHDMWLKLAKDSIFDCIEEPLVIYSLHRNRISTDCTCTLAGRLKMLEKYWDEIKSDKVVLSNHYLRIGSAYCQLGNNAMGRQFIKKSIALHPCNMESLAALIFSHLGYTSYSNYIERYRRFRYYVREKKRTCRAGGPLLRGRYRP